MRLPWSRRTLLVTGSAVVAGGVAAAAVSSAAEAAPPIAPAPGISVVEDVMGQQVSVRTRSAPAVRPREFDSPLRTFDAQYMPGGWSLRSGDLVVVDEVDGRRIAIPLHREVVGEITRVMRDSITVGTQQAGLDNRTALYIGRAVKPLIGSTAHHLSLGDTVVLQCLDNRRDGTLTVHFMRLLARA
jgi:hypothetical protein